jgi:hypothetical protein
VHSPSPWLSIVICHTPSKFLSHPARSCHLRRLKLLKDCEFAALQCPFCNIGVSARPMAAFSGFYESHGPTSLGDACSIVLAYRHGHRNGQQSGHILHHRCSVDCCPGSHWGNTERVVARWRHLVAFYESPGPPSSGDARGISPSHHQGHRNGQ